VTSLISLERSAVDKTYPVLNKTSHHTYICTTTAETHSPAAERFKCSNIAVPAGEAHDYIHENAN